jgi:pimeloyl-ACP methyl ester carboxylesterase
MTSATVEGAGVALAFEERGEGEPTVFVHGIATDRTVWGETLDALGDGVRGIAYDRRAYGESGAPEPYGGTTVGEQADDLAALIRSLDVAPATLCGHGFGALICLDVMMRHPDLAGGGVLIEPPMLWLSAGGSEAMSELREAVEKGAREAGGPGAVDAYLGDAQAALGRERAGAARVALRGFAADLGAVASWAAGRRELRGIEQPAILIAGTRSPPVIRDVARAIADLLPRSELVELDAGHFAQLEQPAAVAEAIRRIASA